MKRPVTCCLLSLVLGAAALAAPPKPFDWPQWQGPDRNAVSKETGLLKEWPGDGPPLAWKVKGLGGGYSAPSVAAGRIYGMSNRGSEQVVWALNEADGKELWVRRLGVAAPQRMPQGKEGPGGTPTVDGERLYVVGSGGEVACLQADDGTVVWQKSLTRDFGGRAPTWSYRESPLVDGEKVVVTPGADDAMLVALNKTNGETVWKTQMPGSAGGGGGGQRDAPVAGRRGGFGGGGGGGAGYSSAIAIDFAGQRQYVQFTARALVGVDAQTGKLLWRYDKPANRNAINITTPLYLGDGLVFASSAYGAGGGLVKLSKDAGGGGDGGVKADEVWFSKNMQNHHGGVIALDGALYGAHGGNEGGFLACLDAQTGKVLWDQRAERKAPKGSVAFADGRLYYRTEDGAMLLVEPSPKQYLERGRFAQPDRSDAPAWSHPVLANGKLYLRDQDVLLCYDVKAK